MVRLPAVSLELHKREREEGGKKDSHDIKGKFKKKMLSRTDQQCWAWMYKLLSRWQ